MITFHFIEPQMRVIKLRALLIPFISRGSRESPQKSGKHQPTYMPRIMLNSNAKIRIARGAHKKKKKTKKPRILKS